MITRTTAYTIDLDRGTVETRWDSPLTYGDKGADRIQVTLTRGSSPATLSGLSVMLYGVRSDGITAIKAGSVSGNVVTAELDYTFYAIPGRLELLLQLTEGTTVVNTPLRITAYVKGGQTDAVVSTGEQFSLAELQAVVAACQSATSSATSAATSANGAATAANTAAGNAQDAADAITGITVGATAVAYGNPPTAVVTEDPGDGHLNVAFGLPTGATGIRGTVTYSGTAITGTSTTPTAYATGIAAAIAGDRYRYNGTVAANVGNEYVCTLGGNATTALWTYDSNVRGAPGTGSVNSVDSVTPDGNGNVALNALKQSGGNMTGAINEALVSSMALSGTMNIGAAAGNYIIVTVGTGPITAFDTAPAGARRFMRFSVPATINYNATTMLIPGAANLNVVSGDVLEWVSGGSGVWRCVNIEKWNRVDTNMITYTDASQIGITLSASTTLEQLASAMPINSMLCIMPSSSATSNIKPPQRRYGSLVIYYLNYSRVTAVWYDNASSSMWINAMSSSDSGSTWTLQGWKRIDRQPQSGTETLTIAVGATSATRAITFSPAFSTAPKVRLTLISTAPNAYTGIYYSVQSAPTVNGFTLVVALGGAPSGSAASISVMWEAEENI